MMFTVLLAIAAGQMASAQPQRGPPPPRIPLPVETGAVQIVQRVDGAGGFECLASSSSAAFQAYGDATCARFRAVGRGPRTGAPVREVTMVIGLAQPGQAQPAELAGRGTLAVDQEAELTVGADGSVAACRVLRNVTNAPAPAAPPMCDRLRQDGPGAFSPGAAGRQARLRTSVFLWLAAAQTR